MPRIGYGGGDAVWVEVGLALKGLAPILKRKLQKKTGRPVQFEITEQTRSSIRDWLSEADLRNARYLFPSRFRAQPHLSARQYARILHA